MFLLLPSQKICSLVCLPGECIQLTIRKQILKHGQGWNYVACLHSRGGRAASQSSQHTAQPSAEEAPPLQGWPHLLCFKPPPSLNQPSQGFRSQGGSGNDTPGR